MLFCYGGWHPNVRQLKYSTLYSLNSGVELKNGYW